MIEGQPPEDWHDLQEKVAKILRECGMDTETDEQLETARGNVNADVLAVDKSQTPPAIYVCECKQWKKRVTKTVVHSLRSVVSDFGANWGLIISSVGFQKGAYEAGRYSNVRLLSWPEFQALFKEKWFDGYFMPRIYQESDALIEYTEPINSRIFRKANSLPEEAQRRFIELRDKYAVLGFLALGIWANRTVRKLAPLELPLRKEQGAKTLDTAEPIPSDLIEVRALRCFLDTYVDHARRAIAEFDELFGERA